jgi:thiamine kinase-like enzyme
VARLSIPNNPYELTPSWLTDALHYKLPSSDASVTSYVVEGIGEGKGFMHQIARLRLDYDSEPKGLPRTTIIKLPSTDPNVKAISDKIGDHQREVRFYEELATSASLRTPYSYYSAIDPVTGHTVLLLEDLGDALQGDSVVGCSQAEAELAIRLLAKFHASWWENSRLEHLDWVPLKDAEISIYQEVYDDAWKTFVQKSGDGMPRELREIGERLSQYIPTIKARLTDHPRTIIHGDYRLDNCFLGTPPNSQSLVVFDWEFCAIGRGTYDAATFINEAFPPQQRRNVEMGLLRMYHSILTENGIRDYSFEECLLDYRFSMLEVFVFWVVVGGYCDYEGDRATKYLHNALERFNAAIADLDCTKLLNY